MVRGGGRGDQPRARAPSEQGEEGTTESHQNAIKQHEMQETNKSQ